MADELGSYWGGLAPKTSKSKKTGWEKTLVALDKLEEKNLDLYETVGIDRELGKRIYREPGTLLMEKAGVDKIPKSLVKPWERKAVETLINFIAPRGIEDAALLGLVGKTTGAIAKGAKSLKQVGKKISKHMDDISRFDEKIINLSESTVSQRASATIRHHGSNVKNSIKFAWWDMKKAFIKKDWWYTQPKDPEDWASADFIAGLKISEDLLPSGGIFSQKTLTQREKLFGSRALYFLTHPTKIKQHVKDSRNFVKNELGSRESFRKFLNTIFPEVTPKKSLGVTTKEAQSGKYIADFDEGTSPFRRVVDDPSNPGATKVLNKRDPKGIVEYFDDVGTREDVIKFLEGNKDLYKIYSGLVKKSVDDTPYSIVFAKGKHANWWGYFEMEGIGKGKIVERWDAVFKSIFTKVHEYTHAVQLRNQNVINKLGNDDLAELVIREMTESQKFVTPPPKGQDYGILISNLPEAIQSIIKKKIIKGMKVGSYKGTHYANQIIQKNKGRSGDLKSFQQFLYSNMKPVAQAALKNPKLTQFAPKGKAKPYDKYSSLEHYYSEWYEVGARINEIRYGEKLGIPATKAIKALESIFPKKFVKKLRDNYWAFLPAGELVWDNDDLWKDKAEVE